MTSNREEYNNDIALENLKCQNLLNFIKKEITPQVFLCEFCEISKNTSSTEHLQATASETKSLLIFSVISP